jgi:hypothetical protein
MIYTLVGDLSVFQPNELISDNQTLMKIAIGGAWLRADIGGEREARPFQY